MRASGFLLSSSVLSGLVATVLTCPVALADGPPVSWARPLGEASPAPRVSELREPKLSVAPAAAESARLSQATAVQLAGYSGVGADAAKRLTLEAFPDLAAREPALVAQLPVGWEITGYPSAYAAQVRAADGTRAVIDATSPGDRPHRQPGHAVLLLRDAW